MLTCHFSQNWKLHFFWQLMQSTVLPCAQKLHTVINHAEGANARVLICYLVYHNKLLHNMYTFRLGSHVLSQFSLNYHVHSLLFMVPKCWDIRVFLFFYLNVFCTINMYIFIGVCGIRITLMWIQIRLFTLLRIRIRVLLLIKVCRPSRSPAFHSYMDPVTDPASQNYANPSESRSRSATLLICRYLNSFYVKNYLMHCLPYTLPSAYFLASYIALCS